jgi:hypothetical protein
VVPVEAVPAEVAEVLGLELPELPHPARVTASASDTDAATKRTDFACIFDFLLIVAPRQDENFLPACACGATGTTHSSSAFPRLKH